MELKDWNYEKIYNSEKANVNYDKIEKLCIRLYYFYLEKLSEVNVKEELKKLADKYADDAIKERQTEDLDNYIAFTLEALRRLGWTGKVRLNRFLSVLTTVSEEAANADDPPAYANQIKERLKKIGVKAFTKNDDATPQLEDHVERNDDK